MLVCFFGRRGSGKTHTIKGQLVDLRPPVVIIDILGNFSKLNIIQTTTIKDAIQQIKFYLRLEKEYGFGEVPASKRIINLQTHDFNLAADYLTAILWEIKGGTLVLDEGDSISFSEAPCYDQGIRYGRNHDIDLIYGCRRPAEIEKNITAGADKFYCFQTHEPRDIDYFYEIFGEDAPKLMKLPRYSGLFLDYKNETRGRFYVDTAGGIHHAGEATVSAGPRDQPSEDHESFGPERTTDAPQSNEGPDSSADMEENES